MKLGENLQAYRKKTGLSQEEFAEKCEVSRQAIAKWESGESVPTIDKLIFLADYYDIAIDELVGRVEKDDYTRLSEIVKRIIPQDIRFCTDDDILPTVLRFFDFMERMGHSAEEKLQGLHEVFCANALNCGETNER